MKKTNVLFQWVSASKRAAMVSAFAVFALFFVGMQGVSAQSLTKKSDTDTKYPAPVFVGPSEAIQALNDGIQLIDDHIENNPNMTDSDIKHGGDLKVTLQLMIDDIDGGRSVEDAFTGRMHEFQVNHPNRDRVEQRKLMRVRKEIHDDLTI